jgi:hypothetical protein
MRAQARGSTMHGMLNGPIPLYIGCCCHSYADPAGDGITTGDASCAGCATLLKSADGCSECWQGH